MTYNIEVKAITINNNENMTDWKENESYLHKEKPLLLQSVPQAYDLSRRPWFNNERELWFGWTQTMLSQVDRMWFV